MLGRIIFEAEFQETREDRAVPERHTDAVQTKAFERRELVRIEVECGNVVAIHAAARIVRPCLCSVSGFVYPGNAT